MEYSLLIIVPTFNSSEYLPNLINSLNKQTSQEWRVIFIDGSNLDREVCWLRNICKNDKRYTYVKEFSSNRSIYGAMNQGFYEAKEDDWLLFWGSDDWCFSNEIVELIINQIKKEVLESTISDLFIYKGKYFNNKKQKYERSSYFSKKNKVYDKKHFLNKLFWGGSPPHQATVFSPKILEKNLSYSTDLELASDLDFFLELTNYKDIKITSFNINIVNMGSNGVSSIKNFTRFYEVIKIYYKYFGVLSIIPFSLRYLKRIISKTLL